MANKPILRRALGGLHTRWLLWPKKAALVAGIWYLAVLISSGFLGIFWSFPADGQQAVGFANSHWGLLFLIAMPLAAWLMGYYFRLLENGLQSIDDVVSPSSDTTARAFSDFVSGRLRYAWASWIFPFSLGGAVILTVVADGRDIIAPLQSNAIPSSEEADWSTLGYAAHPQIPAIWYLAFNLAAWSMQIFLGYSALLVVFLTTFVLGVVFRYGLGGRRVAELLLPPDRESLPEKYRPKWDHRKLRCGLEDLDVIFGFFVGLVIFILLVAAVSILSNAYLKQGADLGSAILAFGAIILLPVAVFWIFHPYFSNFPRELPTEYKDRPGYVVPSPWPFGSEKISWGIVTAAVSLWAFLVWTVLGFIFPGLGGD